MTYAPLDIGGTIFSTVRGSLTRTTQRGALPRSSITVVLLSDAERDALVACFAAPRGPIVLPDGQTLTHGVVLTTEIGSGRYPQTVEIEIVEVA